MQIFLSWSMCIKIIVSFNKKGFNPLPFLLKPDTIVLYVKYHENVSFL